MKLNRKSRHLMLALALAILPVQALQAQQWEAGGGGGASFYNSATVTGLRESATVTLKGGYGFGAYFGQIGNRLGGEIRYGRFSNEMEVAGQGKSYARAGYSQAIHYDLLVYFSGSQAKSRPYVLAGGGMKQYAAIGKDVALPPLWNVVVLTGTSEWKPLAVAGGGVRFKAGEHCAIRTEVLVYMTPAPTKVITPVTGSLTGWFFGFTPALSVSYTW